MTANALNRLLLAGPILRRADAQSVAVWLATSRPFSDTPELHVYPVEGLRQRKPGYSPAVSGPTEHLSYQLGAKLHVHLFLAYPTKKTTNGAAGQKRFPEGRLLAYDFRLPNGQPAFSPREMQSITLPPFDRPTFILQPTTRTARNALYLSCRKFHGAGADASHSAFELLRRHSRDVALRPHSLFMTGDQIYADDVSALLIRWLTELGQGLLGTYEPIPDLPAPEGIKIGGREQLVQAKAKFTSSSAGNHLLTFGEFAAAYLVAWNPEMWPARLPSAGQVHGAMASPGESLGKYQHKHARERRSLLEARRGSEALRRVLANVATYMVFDDHEVTDDWNLNPKWIEEVHGTQAGRRIMANGLAAYWAFQDWGNEPERFRDGALAKTVEDHLKALSSGGTSPHGRRYEEQLLAAHWNYTAPGQPIALVLDARTRRLRHQSQRRWDWDGALPSPRSRKAPLLLDSDALSALHSDLRRAKYRRGHGLLLVTGTPVFGIEGIEALQELIGRLSPTTVDLESWSANPRSFANLLDSLLSHRPNPLVILSGDVHYGFEAGGRLFKGGNEYPFVQLTGSATKNETTGFFRFLFSVLATTLDPTTAKRYWWLPDGYDGSTASQRISIPVIDRALYELKRAFYGSPRFADQTEYAPASRHFLGIFKTLIHHTSNVGSVQIRHRAVTNRLYLRDGGRTREQPERKWPPWPFEGSG
jgi:hypothetical protein